jgi:sugar transferase EpsL
MNIKRLFDFFAACVLLVIFTPVMLICAVAIRVNMGAPVIFRQPRPGLRGVPFEFYKFRTMKDPTDNDGQELPLEVRVTRLGRMLRNTSIDELPQLFNVIKGDLSLVGPRPLLMEYLPLYSAEQARRHDVMPGITGWAQVHGRNSITWEEKFDYDVWYVDNRSFLLDIKILWLTLLKVLVRKDVDKDGYVGQERFMGSNNQSGC